jgi:hypothetical protein
LSHAVTVKGASGSIRYGYHVAATVGAWTVTRAGEGWSLQTTLVQSDAFRLSQQPLAFVVTVQGVSWRWPIVGALQKTGSVVSAQLGPKE